MQLVAYGAQDVYLTGNPQITFFKVVYRRHTNFSMEAIEQTWNGSSVTDGRCTATISRNGDLIHRMYIEVEGSTPVSAENTAFLADKSYNPGSAWITDVEVEIGGQRIDKHSGKFLEVWAQLTERNPNGMVSCGHRKGASGMGTMFQNMAGMGGVLGHYTDAPDEMAGDNDAGPLLRHFHIPLRFWFCKNAGLALPLIALQYHEVKINLNHIIETVYKAGVVANKLWVDYIYLDTDERRRFAQVSHEYLIEQVQERRLQQASGDHELNFNHPVKELIWAGNRPNAIDTEGTADVTGKANNGTGVGVQIKTTSISEVAVLTTIAAGAGPEVAEDKCTFHLKLNGHERFAPRYSTYFSRLQVNEYHSGYGGLNVDGKNAQRQKSNGGGLVAGICVYSFALKPEEHQPSGTCNFSRIDTAHLVSSHKLTENVDCYAINYNVLRIMSGMGGLAYSN